MLVRHHPEFSELPPHLIELSVWRKTSMAPISPCVRTYTLQGYPSLCIINSQFQQKVSLHGNFHSVITGLMNFFSHFSDQFNYSYQLMECFNFEWTYTAVDCICSKLNTYVLMHIHVKLQDIPNTTQSNVTVHKANRWTSHLFSISGI